MELPSAETAVVPAAKVRDYLLSPEHPIGRAKARFFVALGFHHSDWPQLQYALLTHGRSGEAVACRAHTGRSMKSVVSLKDPTADGQRS